MWILRGFSKVEFFSPKMKPLYIDECWKIVRDIYSSQNWIFRNFTIGKIYMWYEVYIFI